MRDLTSAPEKRATHCYVFPRLPFPGRFDASFSPMNVAAMGPAMATAFAPPATTASGTSSTSRPLSVTRHVPFPLATPQRIVPLWLGPTFIPQAEQNVASGSSSALHPAHVVGRSFVVLTGVPHFAQKRASSFSGASHAEHVIGFSFSKIVGSSPSLPWLLQSICCRKIVYNPPAWRHGRCA
jgi:hypothetical protein